MTRFAASPLLLLLISLLGGCVDDLGQFCHDDTDCRAGLRCSGPPAVRGVCTYPGAAADGFPVQDGGRRDGTTEGLGGDLSLDGQLDLSVDGLATDAPPADGRADATPDGTAVDGPGRDGTLPDTTTDAAAKDGDSSD